MRGEFEVWDSDKLVYKDHNMLCDGAGKTLADIMTVSPSFSGIEDHATSSILDASNYTIQAISFGKGSDSFRTNAHIYDADELAYLVETLFATSFGATGIWALATSSTLSFWPGNSGQDCYAAQPVAAATAGSPDMTVLENDTSISSTVGGIEVSSVFPGNGQLTNFLPSAIMSSMMEDTVFSATVSGYVAASLLGCFSDGSSVHVDDRSRSLWPPGGVRKSLPSTGFFNEVSSMDVSGFVNMVMSSVPNPGYDMSSPASGLTLSANSDFSSNGIVEYSVGLGPGDSGQANVYGGIYSLGLWTIDVQQSLINGNTPPFGFSVLNNPRKYRLFARKDLSKSLTNQDWSSANPDQNWPELTIKWRLHFL
jgi:hypothetical protein